MNLLWSISPRKRSIFSDTSLSTSRQLRSDKGFGLRQFKRLDHTIFAIFCRISAVITAVKNLFLSRRKNSFRDQCNKFRFVSRARKLVSWKLVPRAFVETRLVCKFTGREFKTLKSYKNNCFTFCFWGGFENFGWFLAKLPKSAEKLV